MNSFISSWGRHKVVDDALKKYIYEYVNEGDSERSEVLVSQINSRMEYNISELNGNIVKLQDMLNGELRTAKKKAKEYKHKYESKMKSLMKDVKLKIMELENEYKKRLDYYKGQSQNFRFFDKKFDRVFDNLDADNYNEKEVNEYSEEPYRSRHYQSVDRNKYKSGKWG